MTDTRSSGFGNWLLRAALVGAAVVCVWLAEQQHHRWREIVSNTFKVDTTTWLFWLGLTVLAGLLIGLAAALPLRGPYRWGNLIAFGLLPVLAVGHFALFWSSISSETFEDYPEWLVKPRLFDDPGPQAIFMFLLGLALASGFFGSREPAPVAPAAPVLPEA